MLSGNKGQLVDEEPSSGTDSEEDVEGSDDHKLAKIRHAITGTNQPVQVILNGRYRWGDGWDNVSYCRAFKERKVSEDILEPLTITANAIGIMALEAGAIAFKHLELIEKSQRLQLSSEDRGFRHFMRGRRNRLNPRLRTS
jgi:hypothetical protein